MASQFVTSGVGLNAEPGAPSNAQFDFDSGNTGENRALVFQVVYENGGDPGISGVTYAGLPMTRLITQTVSPSDQYSETQELWLLKDPPVGVNTVAMTNAATGHDFVVLGTVVAGVGGDAVAEVVGVSRQLSDNGTIGVNIPMDGCAVWAACQDRGSSAFTAVLGSVLRQEVVTGDNGSGLIAGIGDSFLEGAVTVGANQTESGSGDDQDMTVVAVVFNPFVDSGNGGGGGGTTENFVEDIRVENCILQQKRANESAYVNVHDLTLCGGSGGGGGSVTVEGRAVTTRQLGYIPNSDPAVNAQNLQAFIDTVAGDGVVGVIEAGVWDIDRQINFRDGLRLRGEGMQRTIINCPTASWLDSGNFTAFKLEAGTSLNKAGIQLSDFKVIGADKNATDNGGLIRLQGLEDGIVERLWLEDGSSYGLFIAGYGLGGFTNDIHDDFWNSTFRVVVRDCVTRRGQIGMGCEGGAEGVLFLHNTINSLRDDGSFGLHGFRNPSGYNVRHTGNRVFGCRSAFTLDREKHIEVDGNYVHNCRQGVSVGSFRDSDPEVSKDVKITSNYFHCVEENSRSPVAITDSWLPQGHVEGVVIANNIISQGNISLREVRRAIVTGNVSPFGNANIVTASDATGLVSNNLMGLSNSASGIVDGGNNIS